MPDPVPAASPWLEVPADALQGRGLAPYKEGEITNLFDWAENPGGLSRHLMPHRGQFLVDIVQIENNTVHQPSKPGDEIVLVVHGTLVLTDDGTGKVLTVRAGQLVLIPLGWAGLYQVRGADAPFLELAIVPGDYFIKGEERAPSGLSPRLLDLSSIEGALEVHRGRYAVEARCCSGKEAWSMASGGEQIVLVTAGALTLSSGGRSARLEAGSVVVLPPQVVSDVAAQPGTRVLTLRWLDGAPT